MNDTNFNNSSKIHHFKKRKKHFHHCTREDSRTAYPSRWSPSSTNFHTNMLSLSISCTVILFSSRYLLSAKSICPTCKQTIYISICKTCVLPLPTNRKTQHICVKNCAAGAPADNCWGRRFNLHGYNVENIFSSS